MQSFSVPTSKVIGTNNPNLRKGWPSNFRIGIVLPFKNGEVAGVDTFLGSFDRYVNVSRNIGSYYLTRESCFGDLISHLSFGGRCYLPHGTVAITVASALEQ